MGESLDVRLVDWMGSEKVAQLGLQVVGKWAHDLEVIVVMKLGELKAGQ